MMGRKGRNSPLPTLKSSTTTTTADSPSKDYNCAPESIKLGLILAIRYFDIRMMDSLDLLDKFVVSFGEFGIRFGKLDLEQ